MNYSRNCSQSSIDLNLLNKIDAVILFSIQYIGLVSNTLMLVLFYQPHLRQLSVSTYIRWLAFFCACHNSNFLFVAHNPRNFANKFEIICRVRVFLHLSLQPLCAWFEVVAVLGRFLTILFPYKFVFMRKPNVKLLLS